MVITFLAPKGGVGSSTMAALAAWEVSLREKVLLVDAASDPSLDIFTDTAHLVSAPFTGSIQDVSVVPRERENLQILRFPPDANFEKLASEFAKLQDTWVILDAGVPNDSNLREILKFSQWNVVVLNQDNQVLRSADDLLGRIRRMGGRAVLFINRQEARPPSELGDMDEIYSLFEEDCLGILANEPKIRILTNTGKLDQLPEKAREEIQAFLDRIRGEAEDTRTRPMADNTNEMSPLSEEGDPSSDPTPMAETASSDEVKSHSVLEGIRAFLHGFRKGQDKK